MAQHVAEPKPTVRRVYRKTATNEQCSSGSGQAAEAGESDDAIAANVSVGGSTVHGTKRRFVLGNLEAALSEEPRPGAERKLSDKQEALLVATACAKPPKGRKRWTLELLVGEMVKLTDHEGLSRETVRPRLEENDLKPWLRDMWCIPPVDGA